MPRRSSSSGRGQNVAVLGVAAEGQDGGMLDQQQPIADQAVRAARGELLLKRPGLAIRNPPEPRRREQSRAEGSVLVSTFGTIAGGHHPAIPAGPPAGVGQCLLTTGCGITHVVRRLAPDFRLR